MLSLTEIKISNLNAHISHLELRLGVKQAQTNKERMWIKETPSVLISRLTQALTQMASDPITPEEQAQHNAWRTRLQNLSAPLLQENPSLESSLWRALEAMDKLSARGSAPLPVSEILPSYAGTIVPEIVNEIKTAIENLKNGRVQPAQTSEILANYFYELQEIKAHQGAFSPEVLSSLNTIGKELRTPSIKSVLAPEVYEMMVNIIKPQPYVSAPGLNSSSNASFRPS